MTTQTFLTSAEPKQQRADFFGRNAKQAVFCQYLSVPSFPKTSSRRRREPRRATLGGGMDGGLLVLAAAIVVAALLLRRRGSSDPDEATRTLQIRVDQTAASMSELLGKFEERRRLEEQATGAVGRIERLVAGSWARGRAGENLLAAALGEFPPDMVQRDFTLGGRVCEFALALPDGKFLPIDSKWPGVEIAARMEQELDPAARDELRRRVERVVCGRLREVAGYVDASLTAPLAVMAVAPARCPGWPQGHPLPQGAPAAA